MERNFFTNVAFFFLINYPQIIFSEPVGENCILGDVAVHRSTPNMVELNQRSQNAIIEWHDFSIDIDEAVAFNQPTSESCILNRVVGNQASKILGKVLSNGKVILINPQGILFGKAAQLNLQSFMASTYDVANEQFALISEYKVKTNSPAEILNLGNIKTVGDLHFCSENIKNYSSLSSSESINLFDPACNGEIKNTGSLTAPRIDLNSSSIFLNENSVLDASHCCQGGSISISGINIFVSASSTLLANSHGVGDGGIITILGQHSTRFDGKIFACANEFGKGGFAEVSGKNHLDYRGIAYLSGKSGINGTLLLDPTDIIIGVGGGAPTACAICASGTCGPIPGQCSTFLSGNLDAVSLQTQLQTGACDVIIDASGAGAGSGTITHNPGANISWNSSNSLTYNALGNITILSNVLNSGPVGAAGNIFIRTQGGTVQINTLANTQSSTIGSQHGITQVCAPNADVVLQSPITAADRHAQIGFLAPEGMATNCSGPILISCRNLSLLNSSQSNVAAQIGHGQSGALGGGLTLTTETTATISISASGDVLIYNSPVGIGAGNQTACRIGHGAQILVGPSFLRGDISVIAGGRVDLLSRTAAGIGVAVSNIGHGETNSGGAPYSVSGNIFVQSGSDINIAYVSPYIAGFSTLGIGSNGNSFTVAPGVSGNFTIIAGRDLNMTGPIAPNTLNRMIIGWFGPGNASQINTLINVSACRDINLTVNDIQSDFFFIGSSTSGNNFGANNNVQVSAGRDLNFNTSAPSGGAIGNCRGRIGNPGVSGVSNTLVNAGRNINISGSRQLGIQAYGFVSVSAGGDISLTTLGTAATEFAYIGTNRGNTALTTTIYAAGSIIATNSAAARAILGRGAVATATYASSLDMRAGGNIQIASPYTLNAGNVVVPTTGSIFIEADTILPAGSLWTSSAGQMNTICNVGLPTSIPLSTACGLTTTALDSIGITPDFLGGLTFNAGALGGFVSLQTTNQPISLHSSPNLINGTTTPDLIVGTGANNVQIITTSGAIDISGSVCQTGFNNIVFSSAANPWTSGGNVLGRAANEIQVNTPIVTAGLGNTISLSSDCDYSGGGNLTINDDVATNNGEIFLSAAANPNCANTYFCSEGFLPGINSSVIQNGGQISANAGTISIQASQNIVIDGDPISVISTSGTIQTRAGNDTFVYKSIENSLPSGIIQMISGNSMFMIDGTISTPNQVVIVVDDRFPSAPLIGTGFFSMDVSSSITGSEIRIYSARQSFNSILGTLNSTLFAPGTLYVDTTSEQWSTYFSCVNPFVNLGLPFTIFYKDSFQEAIQQAMTIVDQFLVDLHPYNEFPGWLARFLIINTVKLEADEITTPYFIRRRALNKLNHPKSWTTLNLF